MAQVRPFAALRPRPELAARICEPPYDVLSSEEAKALAQGNPLSFLRVSKPEIDLPAGTSLYADAVYARGQEHFARLIREQALVQDAQPAFYLYRQIMGQHAQTGLVAVTSCREYLDGIIKKHEFTRPDKEDDRTRHIETLNAQTGPAFLVYPSQPSVNALVARVQQAAPEVDFTAADGIRHSAWVVSSPADIQFLQDAFAALPALYIADGHHRSAAAGRVFQNRQGAGGSGGFLSVIFPDDQVQILAYNRVIKDLHGLTPEAFHEKLQPVFDFERDGRAQPEQPQQVGLYLGGRWRGLRFKPALVQAADAVGRLDVSLLQNHVLAPLLGIADPRTSKRIQFVGGIRGTAELEKLVNSGEHACAFAMYPTGIQELMAIAEAGGIMPPKSTWFEPKLRDAMFCHLI